MKKIDEENTIAAYLQFILLNVANYQNKEIVDEMVHELEEWLCMNSDE